MRRYHFNLVASNGESIADDEGAEYQDLENAYLAAFECALELWGPLLRSREDPRERAFQITDEKGEVLMILPFNEILEVCRPVKQKQPSASSDSKTPNRYDVLAREFGTPMRAGRAEIARSEGIIGRSRRLASKCRYLMGRTAAFRR